MPTTMSPEMSRAGYASLIRHRVQGSPGPGVFAVEFRIDGRNFAAGTDDLRAAIAGRTCTPIYRLIRCFGERFEGAAGTVERSVSGRALNLTLGEAGRFTVSCASLAAVIDGRARYAFIAALPGYGGRSDVLSSQPRQAVLGV
jgi:hypothetical protein